MRVWLSSVLFGSVLMGFAVACSGRALDWSIAGGGSGEIDTDGVTPQTVDLAPSNDPPDPNGPPDLGRTPDAVTPIDPVDPLDPPPTDTPKGYIPDPCGNGVLDPGEECDEGLLTGFGALWYEQLGQSNIPMTPVRGVLSALDYYCYEDGSSHIGNEAVGESRVILYHSRNTNLLSVIVSHGAADASSQGRVHIDFDFSFPGHIGLCDGHDPMQSYCELYGGFKLLRATWDFDGQSDGLILGHGDTFMNVIVKPIFYAGIERWVLFDGALQKQALDASLAMTIRSLPSTTCRLDCTLP